MSLFQKATKLQSKLRLALIGPSGSGKTYSALSLASQLGKRIAVVDTEHGSASKYADLFDFDVCELSSFHPQQYVSAIAQASEGGYDVLIIDSLSHAWMGRDGALELVDREVRRQSAISGRDGNSYTAWREVTPQHNALVEALLRCQTHLIVTMRSKTEYVLEQNSNGKTVPRKVGMAPIQRDGLEYEFDVVGDMTLENDLVVSKSRCPALSGQVIAKPGAQMAAILENWLTEGAPAIERFDREAVMTETQAEMQRLGWSNADGKIHLQTHYHKKSRQMLTDAELDHFLSYLQEQSIPSTEHLPELATQEAA